MQTRKWQVQIRNSIGGAMLCNARRNSRGRWMLGHELPIELTDYLDMQQSEGAAGIFRYMGGNFENYKVLLADEGIQLQRSRYFLKFIVTIEEPDPPRKIGPAEAAAVRSLDAYGHLNYTVGFGDEGDARGDWMACFDFVVFGKKRKMVAYEVVVNSESASFVDGVESTVVPADHAPFNLPDHWTGIGTLDDQPWTDTEYKQAQRVNDKWNADLKAALA